MFLLIAVALAVVAWIHGARKGATLTDRVELVLVYLLAGYHGAVMLGVSILGLLSPERAAAMVGAELGNPFQDFFMAAYFGMSVAAILAVWFRRHYLIGPVVCWSIYFLGATYVHWRQFSAAA